MEKAIVRLAINGFGRIGRLVLRAARENPAIQIVAINDLTDAKTLAHLLKYDSVHGRFQGRVEPDGDHLVVDGVRIPIYSQRDPAALPWGELAVDVVLESTGVFRTRSGAGKHLEAGAKWVIISAPGKKDKDGTDIDATIVMGVNDDLLDPKKHRVISNASCTTNCLAPVAKVLNDTFGLEHGIMTTIHAYTNDQKILDLPHSDLRRARAAAVSMIPTTTGAAKAVGLVLPELQGKLNGMAIRVPTSDVSLVDLVATTRKPVTVEAVNGALKRAAETGPLAPYLDFCEEPLVSIDFVGNEASSTVDAGSTLCMGPNLVKVLSWYDNEYGYACRTRDLILKLIGK